jgi:hypothetical protein
MNGNNLNNAEISKNNSKLSSMFDNYIKRPGSDSCYVVIGRCLDIVIKY